MPRLTLAVAMLAGATLLGTVASHAEPQWCARYDVGQGDSVERCEFHTFEACLAEIRGGNRGFCTQNPRWAGSQPEPRRPRRH